MVENYVNFNGRTFKIFPEIVPLPPPGFPRINAKLPSSSGADTVMDDMKLRCFDAVAKRLTVALANPIIFEAFSGRTKLVVVNEYIIVSIRYYY